MAPSNNNKSKNHIKVLRVAQKQIDNYRGIIRINVGADDKQDFFDVHETLLTSRSIFFKNALSGDWKEGKDKTVNLPEDSPDVFAAYVHLLYSGTVATMNELEDTAQRADAEYIILAKLYVLSEKLQDMEAKNEVVRAIQVAGRSTYNSLAFPGVEPVKIIYNGTLPSSLARKLLVDFYMYRAGNDLTLKLPDFPLDFIYELTAKCLQNRSSGLGDDPTRSGDGAGYLEKKGESET